MERSLGTKQINIIPSIEGKPSLSHIEVPKRIKVETLYLRDVLKTAEFQAQAKTAIPLGQDIVGDTVYKRTDPISPYRYCRHNRIRKISTSECHDYQFDSTE